MMQPAWLNQYFSTVYTSDEVCQAHFVDCDSQWKLYYIFIYKLYLYICCSYKQSDSQDS